VKKAFSIFILGVLFCNGIGFYAYYAVELLRIKLSMREAMAQMPPDALQLIRLNVAEFKHVLIDEQELELGGKMYDIAYTRCANGIMEVYCLEDKAEGNLIRFISKVIGEPVDPESVPGVAVNFVTLLFMLPERLSLQPSCSQLAKGYSSEKFRPSDGFTLIPNPPPLRG
jgi:hypothetical protein